MNVAVEQFRIEFLCEESLAADLGQRFVEDFVALGSDDFFFACKVWIKRLQRVDHPLGLPAGEGRGSRCKDQFHVHLISSVGNETGLP
jgi:hypothetical protein